MKKIYVILLADLEGNFDWIYTLPYSFYMTRKEAEQMRQELIKNEKTITDKNSKVKRLWKLPQ